MTYRELFPSPRGNHELLLHDRKTQEEASILVFDRHAEVLWSPGCAAFAVTDWNASNASRVLLFNVASAKPLADFADLIANQLGRVPSIFENHHVYLRAAAWPSSNIVHVDATGYGDINPSGFEALFEYELGASVRLVPKPK